MARIYSLHFSLFSMARIISFINQKGGTGKSTSAVNTAAYLAHRGKYVLLIDLDPQANATSGLGFAPQKLDKSLYDVLTQGDLPDGIIQRTQLTGYDLLPSSYDLAGASIELVNVPRDSGSCSKIVFPKLGASAKLILRGTTASNTRPG